MNFTGDYHTHTKMSDGRQTEEQVIKAAQKKGLKEVAITDHGPLAAGIGVKHPSDYLELKEKIRALNLDMEKLSVLVGAEANIRDLNGTLDIPENIVEQLDILIVGLHPYTLPERLSDGVNIFLTNSLRHFGKSIREKAVNNNTKACIEALYQNPGIDIIAHPGLFFKVHIDELSKSCIKNRVLFEINCGHEYPAVSDIMEADRQGVDFIINSDAHFEDSVGKLDYGKHVIEKLEIDPDRVVNLGPGEGFKRWGKKWNICTY
ncbi:MAG: PHP domain-containing protein [Syntrophomonadaceae bacterium]|jgi:putative hydrolase